jgi:hypothetical protein
VYLVEDVVQGYVVLVVLVVLVVEYQEVVPQVLAVVKSVGR